MPLSRREWEDRSPIEPASEDETDSGSGNIRALFIRASSLSEKHLTCDVSSPYGIMDPALMAGESILGRYARIVVDQGTAPLQEGLKFACRITGLTTDAPAMRKSSLRGEVVSNDVDGPLDPSLIEGSLIISPEDPEVSEGSLLRGGSCRANLSLLSIDGEIVAHGQGALTRLSEEVPFESVCPDCQGWKICEDCGATGGGPSAVCAYCRGTGQCHRCAGRGMVTESG